LQSNLIRRMRVNLTSSVLAAASLVSGALAQKETMTTPHQMPTPEIDYYAAAPPHPTRDEFFSHLTYPYHATADRQRRIEDAARVIQTGKTELQILDLLGQPDYKAPAYHFIDSPQRFVADEVWHYVHTIEQPPRYDRPGKMLLIMLSNRSKPRRVIEIDKVEF